MPVLHEAVAANNRVPFQITHVGASSVSSTWKGRRPRNIDLSRTHSKKTRISSASRCAWIIRSMRSHELQRVDDPRLGFPATREELLTYDVVICSDIAVH